MKSKKIKILIDLGVGKSNAKMTTCDYSYDYIRINASYKTWMFYSALVLF